VGFGGVDYFRRLSRGFFFRGINGLVPFGFVSGSDFQNS
jgi:hypothetical protein